MPILRPLLNYDQNIPAPKVTVIQGSLYKYCRTIKTLTTKNMHVPQHAHTQTHTETRLCCDTCPDRYRLPEQVGYERSGLHSSIHPSLYLSLTDAICSSPAHKAIIQIRLSEGLRVMRYCTLVLTMAACLPPPLAILLLIVLLQVLQCTICPLV